MVFVGILEKSSMTIVKLQNYFYRKLSRSPMQPVCEASHNISCYHYYHISIHFSNHYMFFYIFLILCFLCFIVECFGGKGCWYLWCNSTTNVHRKRKLWYSNMANFDTYISWHIFINYCQEKAFFSRHFWYIIKSFFYLFREVTTLSTKDLLLFLNWYQQYLIAMDL